MTNVSTVSQHFHNLKGDGYKLRGVIMKKLISALLALIVTAFSNFSVANCDPNERVVKFSFVTKEKGHPKGEAAAAIAKRVNKEMNGKMCMILFPEAELYDDTEVMEALLLGEIQLAAPSLSKLDVYSKKYRLFDLPFLFENMQAVDRFIKSNKGQRLLSAMEDKGYIGLSYIYNGLKNFSADKRLEKPQDARGLRFRVQASDVAVAMVEATGGNAHKLPFSQVRSALQTGLVNGQENTWSNIYTQSFFEVQDFITETNHQLLAYLTVTSEVWLKSVSETEREQFTKIVQEETMKANEQAAQLEMQNKQHVVQAIGADRIVQLTSEQRNEWRELMKPIWLRFADGIGQELIEAAMDSNN